MRGNVWSRIPARPPATAALDVPPGGSLRVAIVADTHGTPHPDVASLLGGLSPDAILHAGDIGDLSVIDQLSRIAPTFAVRGNIDGTRTAGGARRIPDALMLELRVGGRLGSRWWLTHIAVRGPRLYGDVRRYAKAAGVDLVVCGHSHVPLLASDDGVGVFNPGSIGPRRFTLPITFGVAEVSALGLDLWHVDCETGERWTPHPGGARSPRASGGGA